MSNNLSSGAEKNRFLRLLLTIYVFLFLVFIPASVNSGMLSPFVEEKITVTPGRDYMVGSGPERPLRIKNTGTNEIRVKFEVSIPREKELAEGYKPLLQPEWIQFSETAIEIPPEEWGETTVIVNIPGEEENYEKKYQATLVSVLIPERGIIEGALRSRLLIETKKDGAAEE